MERYDVLCVGVGGVGSAAAYHLAARGLKVLGLDRFSPGHDRGSSHGESRIIRLVYREHPDYVPLLRRAYELWERLGERLRRPILHRTGILYAGAGRGGVIDALESCAAQHGLALERLSAGEAMRRFSAFRIPADSEAAFESVAGYLEVEACVRAYADWAVAAGAEVRIGETVQHWEAGADGVVVTTDAGRYAAQRLVLAPGAWAPQLLRLAEIELTVKRKELFWYAAPGEEHTRAGGCPLFYFETGDGSFYGFPDLGGNGLKVAEHSGGQFTSVRTAAQQLARIDDASRNGYILGYTPTNPNLDGKYRNVDVEVSRRSVTVIYRRGYTARADPLRIDPRELLIRTRLRNAATSDVPLDDIRMKIAAVADSSDSGARLVRVDLKVDPSSLSLSQENGKWVGTIDLLILLGDSQQNVVGRLEQQMRLGMSPTLYEQAKADWIPYQATVAITGRATLAKAIIYDFESDRLGAASTSVK